MNQVLIEKIFVEYNEILKLLNNFIILLNSKKFIIADPAC